MNAAAQTSGAFISLCGRANFASRIKSVTANATPGSRLARATQQRHALEITLARLAAGTAPTSADRRVSTLASEALALAQLLPAASRDRLRAKLGAALGGDATLVPVFHMLRTAALLRERGFDVTFSGLLHDTAHDLTIRRAGCVAAVACETISAEDGRPLHRGDWYALVDRVNPDLQTWLAAHPGRYLLKMTLPEGLSGDVSVAELHARITAMLTAEKRQDAGAQAVLKLDPLLLAGAQAADRDIGALPGRLRAQFGPEAHLAVTTCGGDGGGSVFVMAARAGRENEIAHAVCRRLTRAAAARLPEGEPGILAVFLEDIDRVEWRGLRDRLELEGAVRRFLTTAEARRVAAVSCASRHELFGAPDAAPEGELRFRNPSHPQAKLPALAPAISSFA